MLAHPKLLPEPIRDSLEITSYLYQHYPDLCPSTHSQQIGELLGELHSLNYFVLSFTTKPERAAGLRAELHKRLEKSDISARYRSALEHKLTMSETMLIPSPWDTS